MIDKEILEVAKNYEFVFGSEAGKKVLEDFEKSFMNKSSHVPGDPYTTSFNEGCRDVVLRIKWMLKIASNPSDKLVEKGKVGNYADPASR